MEIIEKVENFEMNYHSASDMFFYSSVVLCRNLDIFFSKNEGSKTKKLKKHRRNS